MDRTSTLAGAVGHRSPDCLCRCFVDSHIRQPGQEHSLDLLRFTLYIHQPAQWHGAGWVRYRLPGRHVSPYYPSILYLGTNRMCSGTAAGLAGTSRLLAGAVATAIFGNVTNNKYASTIAGAVGANVARFNLPTATLTRLIAAARLNTAAAFRAVPGITPEIQAAAILGNKQAYLTGAHLSYQVALAFGLCGVIAAFFLSSVDERKYTEKTVAVQGGDRKALAEKKMEGAA